MKIINIKDNVFTEELVDDLDFKQTFDNRKPGSNKTRKTHLIIDRYLRLGKRVGICMTNHKLIDEFIGRLDPAYKHDYFHFRGKEHWCLREDIQDAYLIGCGPCENMRSCGYIAQFKVAKEKSILFVVPQHLFILNISSFKPDILSIDETIETLAQQLIVPPSSLLSKGVIDFIPKLCKPNHCVHKECKRGKLNIRLAEKAKKEKNLDFKYIPCHWRVFASIKMDTFEPEDIYEYFFKKSIQDGRDIAAIWDEKTKSYKIGVEAKLDFLQNIDSIMFNCATTDIKVAEKMFGFEFDQIYKETNELKNDIYCLDEAMTITRTRKLLPQLKQILNLFKIPTTNDTLIFSKQLFENYIKDMLPDIQTSHYGISRGTNLFEGVKHVVLFGRFMFTEEHRWILKYRGFDDKTIDKMCASEEEQAFNRARPYLHPDVKVYLFTNSLLNNVITKSHNFKNNHLQKALSMLENKEELTGKTKTQIHNSMKGKEKDINTALELLHKIGWIKDMSKRGSTFQ